MWVSVLPDMIKFVNTKAIFRNTKKFKRRGRSKNVFLLRNPQLSGIRL